MKKAHVRQAFSSRCLPQWKCKVSTGTFSFLLVRGKGVSLLEAPTLIALLPSLRALHLSHYGVFIVRLLSYTPSIICLYDIERRQTHCVIVNIYYRFYQEWIRLSKSVTVVCVVSTGPSQMSQAWHPLIG